MARGEPPSAASLLAGGSAGGLASAGGLPSARGLTSAEGLARVPGGRVEGLSVRGRLPGGRPPEVEGG